MIDDLIANGDFEVAWDLCEERGWFLVIDDARPRSWMRGFAQARSSTAPPFVRWGYYKPRCLRRAISGDMFQTRVVDKTWDMATSGDKIHTFSRG